MKKPIFLVFFLTVISLSVFAQTQTSGGDNSGAYYDDSTVFVIREIEFIIDGRTRPFALMANGEFIEGQRITGWENFQAYVALKRQLLLNKRLLEEVNIEYFLGESSGVSTPKEDGAVPVKLLVRVQDARNLVVFPLPQYSTSNGLKLGMRLRDYNFLGTMSTLKFDFDYRQKDSDKSFNFSIESDTPFQAGGLIWSVRSNHFFDHTVGLPLFYQNVSGISVQLPRRAASLTVGVNQYLTFNEEPGPESTLIYGVSDTYRPYGATELFVSRKIPIGKESGDFGQLAYTPRIAGKINYPTGDMDEPRKPSATFSHSLEFGRIDWVGNYRRGLAASIDNSFDWYINRDDAPYRTIVDGNVTLHRIFTTFAGFSTRLRYRQWWQRSDVMNDGSGGWIPYFDAGDVLRGVPDMSLWRNKESGLQADRILSLNIDVPIKVLDFRPSVWLDSRKLRLFDFQLHFSPFFDAAMIQGPTNDFKPQEMITTAGFEFIAFSGFFKNLQLRASVGYNLGNFNGITKWDEIFVGTAFHY